MELAAAKMIGAGLAAIALAGVGVGMGTIFGNYLSLAQLLEFPNLIYFQILFFLMKFYR